MLRLLIDELCITIMSINVTLFSRAVHDIIFIVGSSFNNFLL